MSGPQWVQTRDYRTGIFYWVDERTRQIAWSRPEALGPPPHRFRPATAHALPCFPDVETNSSTPSTHLTLCTYCPLECARRLVRHALTAQHYKTGSAFVCSDVVSIILSYIYVESERCYLLAPFDPQVRTGQHSTCRSTI